MIRVVLGGIVKGIRWITEVGAFVQALLAIGGVMAAIYALLRAVRVVP